MANVTHDLSVLGGDSFLSYFHSGWQEQELFPTLRNLYEDLCAQAKIQVISCLCLSSISQLFFPSLMFPAALFIFLQFFWLGLCIEKIPFSKARNNHRLCKHYIPKSHSLIMHWKSPGSELGQPQKVLSLYPFLRNLNFDKLLSWPHFFFRNFDQFSNCLSRQGACILLLCHS